MPRRFAPIKKEQLMKHSFTLRQLIPRPGRFGSALAGLALLAMAASSSWGQVLPPSSLPYGLSYQEWSAKWWQFYYSQSTDNMSSLGSPDICAEPASRVVFLGGEPASTTKTNRVTILAGTPLFFSILAVETDNTACPTNSFTTNSADALTSEAIGEWEGAATVTTCTIDGVAVPGLDSPTNTIYNVVSAPFSYTTAEKNNVVAVATGDPCLPGGLTVYPTVADGVYLMVAPLAPGRHTIHYIGVAGPLSAPFLVLDITYDITVIPLR
jgi:hypothetical protein